MKILVISPLFYPLAGGSQQYMADIFTALHQKNPHLDIDLLCYNTENSKPNEIYQGLNIYRINAVNVLYGQFALPNPISLINFLLKHRDYQVVVFNTRFFDSSWWGVIYTKLIGARSILIDHCAAHPKHANFIIRLIAEITEKTVVKASLKHFDVIFSISQATQQFLKRQFLVDSILLYGGVNSELFKPLNKKEQILFIGRLISSKNPQAIIKLAQAFPKQKFLIIGTGPLKTNLQNLTNKYNVKNLQLLGNLPQTKVAKILGQSTILINPSSHHEGIPTVLKEAGASKVAVIATDNGGTNEIIINNQTGLVVSLNDQSELANALNRLINNQTLQKRLSNKLYKLTLEKFNWEQSAEKLYQEITNHK